MKRALSADEHSRLEALHGLEILDTPPTPEFDALTELACAMFGAPICMVSLIDAERQWLKAARGLDARQMPRGIAFCDHVVRAGAPMVVPDAAADARFAGNPLVAGKPCFRFYAGVPIASQDRHVGAFCIVDHRPRAFSDADLARLARFAEICEMLLEQHRIANAQGRLTREIDAQRAAVETRTRELHRKNQLLDCASRLGKLGAWEYDVETGTHLWSDGMFDLHEVDRSFKATDESFLQFYPAGERARVKALIAEARRTKQPYMFEGPMITAKGNRRWVRVAGTSDTGADGKVRRFGIKQDITAEKEHAEAIQRLAEQDGLTGLLNRAQLRNRLRRLCRDGKRPVTLLLLDLDGFKDINDTHGHAAGDFCLKRMARRLRALKAREPLLARIGGDEFAIVLEGMDAAAAADFCTRLNEKVAQPLRWGGHGFQITTSIGVVQVAAGSKHDPDELIRNADLALYEAKAAGRNRHAFYHPDMRRKANRRFEVIHDVRRALAHDQLEMFFQPKVALRDRSHLGFEALLRWRTAPDRVCGPDTFRAALEDPNLSARIGEHVIRTTLRQAGAWTAAGVAFGSVAINLGAAQFGDPGLAAFIMREMQANGLRPEMVEVEVTEGVFLSRASDNALNICRTLKQNGVRIAFDDFGTGFASLTHLREFPVDVIKIDRSFVSRIGGDHATTAIVTAIAGLARSLDLTIVAEGVETEEQATLLLAMGCPCAQGYLFSPPVPAVEAVARITSPGALSAR